MLPPRRLAPCRLLLAAAALVLASTGASAQNPLRIATEGAYPPFNSIEAGEPAGFEVDLARALCDAMAVSCTIVLQEWDGLSSGLKAGRYDAIMSSMEITDERRRRYEFSKPYYRMPSALIGQKSDETAKGAAPDLADRSVGAVADSEFAAYLEALPKPADIRTYAKLDEANLDLLTGRIDYVLGDRLALSKFLATREGKGCCRLVASPPVDRGEGYGVAVRRGDLGLAATFDRALERVVADGSYDRIRAKYFPFDIK